jgi:hypothetical protein
MKLKFEIGSGDIIVTAIVVTIQNMAHFNWNASFSPTRFHCLSNAFLNSTPNLLGMPLEFFKMAPAIPPNTESGTDYYAKEESHLVGTKDGHSFAVRRQSAGHPDPVII